MLLFFILKENIMLDVHRNICLCIVCCIEWCERLVGHWKGTEGACVIDFKQKEIGLFIIYYNNDGKYKNRS